MLLRQAVLLQGSHIECVRLQAAHRPATRPCHTLTWPTPPHVVVSGCRCVAGVGRGHAGAAHMHAAIPGTRLHLQNGAGGGAGEWQRDRLAYRADRAVGVAVHGIRGTLPAASSLAPLRVCAPAAA